ncbi:hypothetical protein JXA56_00140 [Candidatus Micrarchaeota archaeon]|nr:hypothetical protein [Candidatus Micrarchaeota archaeon]
MYYYPNNIYEHILIFRKGKFDFKAISAEEKEKAQLGTIMFPWNMVRMERFDVPWRDLNLK